MDAAIECKSTKEIRPADLMGLRVLAEEDTVKRRVVVSRVDKTRSTEDGIDILPCRSFCQELWDSGLL